MKAFVLGLPLLAGLPGVLPAQSRVQISVPSIRVSLGPISVRAGLENGRVAVRASPATVRTPGTRAPATTRRASATAAGILATADRYVGSRYSYGGESPGGFDCSGFVQYVYRRHGVELPRTSREQAGAGTRLPPGAAALRPGDLLLFATTGGRVDHVAIYAGEGRIIHSSASGGGVGYDDLSSSRGRWFLARHVASRRVI
jgi:cell wall-associated NlpC family hydrolase